MAEAQTVASRKRVRKFFGKIAEVAEMPNLIEVQKESYRSFLQVKERRAAGQRGLQAVFKSVFPISDFTGQAMLDSSATSSNRRNMTSMNASSAA